MDAYRIKVKIGEHEFEAEGSAEIVQSQFEMFKQLIAAHPPTINTPSAQQKQVESPGASTTANGELSLERIARMDGRVVSLTVKPESETVAAMLIMLGQKTFRDNDTVTASEIKDGLEQSGYRPTRVDRIMQPLADEGSVIRIGQRKGTRYRFTNQGIAKAKTTAKAEQEQVSE